jgi:2-keto-3-deoxy-L-rhamnonate aldolase RhmA
MPLKPSQQRIKDGLPVIAVNIGGRNPDILKALGAAGAHVAFVDCERTGIGLDAATDVIRAAQLAGMPAIVRSWSKDPNVLVQYFDRDADGIVVPHIDTAQDAKDVVELVRYACGERAADKTVIVQIETAQAVRNLDEIIAVPGLDLYLIGPNDLAYSLMGKRGAQTPEVMDTVADVSRRLKAAGKRFGLPAKFGQMRPFLDSGATFLYFPVEWLLQKAVADLRAEMGL